MSTLRSNWKKWVVFSAMLSWSVLFAHPATECVVNNSGIYPTILLPADTALYPAAHKFTAAFLDGKMDVSAGGSVQWAAASESNWKAIGLHPVMSGATSLECSDSDGIPNGCGNEGVIPNFDSFTILVPNQLNEQYYLVDSLGVGKEEGGKAIAHMPPPIEIYIKQVLDEKRDKDKEKKPVKDKSQLIDLLISNCAKIELTIDCLSLIRKTSNDE